MGTGLGGGAGLGGGGICTVFVIGWVIGVVAGRAVEMLEETERGADIVVVAGRAVDVSEEIEPRIEVFIALIFEPPSATRVFSGELSPSVMNSRYCEKARTVSAAVDQACGSSWAPRNSGASENANCNSSRALAASNRARNALSVLSINGRSSNPPSLICDARQRIAGEMQPYPSFA